MKGRLSRVSHHLFQEQLLGVMDRKEHWAWTEFTSGRVAKERLNLHLEQEYATYVRDFPVLVGRAYVQCPIPEARRELIENIYEEETGRLVAGQPHPELFLRYPRGLGMDLSRFDTVTLLPKAQTYRNFLDDMTQHQGWAIAAAVTTLFIEGTKWDRHDTNPELPARVASPLEQHPLVKHYGLPLENLDLTRAHRLVEGEHRESAWRTVLTHVEKGHQANVTNAMEMTLQHWKAYRDDVAQACGLTRKP